MGHRDRGTSDVMGPGGLPCPPSDFSVMGPRHRCTVRRDGPGWLSRRRRASLPARRIKTPSRKRAATTEASARSARRRCSRSVTGTYTGALPQPDHRRGPQRLRSAVGVGGQPRRGPAGQGHQRGPPAETLMIRRIKGTTLCGTVGSRVQRPPPGRHGGPWTLHQLRHSALTHTAEEGGCPPLRLATHLNLIAGQVRLGQRRPRRGGLTDPIIVPVRTALIGVAMRAIAVAELLSRAATPPNRARAGQVGFDGRRIGAPQPDRQEPQLTAHLIQLRAQVGALKVVGEAFPQKHSRVFPAAATTSWLPAALPVARQRSGGGTGPGQRPGCADQRSMSALPARRGGGGSARNRG